ncbi:MAG: hypothetical protein ABSA52_21115 [Candidatus Binatia bacterium]|jgi:hypothetical protein
MRGESGAKRIAEPKPLPTSVAPAAVGNVRPYLSIQQLAEVTPWIKATTEKPALQHAGILGDKGPG